MQIVHTAAFTIADGSSQVSLTTLVFPAQVVPYGEALADLPRGVSRTIDALEMRHLAVVPTADTLILAVSALLLEEHADWARTPSPC